MMRYGEGGGVFAIKGLIVFEECLMVWPFFVIHTFDFLFIVVSGASIACPTVLDTKDDKVNLHKKCNNTLTMTK